MEHQAVYFDPGSTAFSHLQPGDSQEKLKGSPSEEHLGIQNKAQNQRGSIKQMSENEMKIREELEMDIVEDLEGEIKDEISRLALRLHSLYQHKKNKQTTSSHTYNHAGQYKQSSQVIHQMNNKNITKNHKTLSEVNISIKMEGGTKVEVKEIKKPHVIDRLHVDKHNVSNNAHQKFDWTKSLRSGPPNSSLRVVRSNKETRKQHPRTSPTKSNGNKIV